MAGSINKVMLIGYLGRDPEARGTQAGELVVSFALATLESWRDQTSGELRQRTDWHHVVIFDEQLGQIAVKYLRKGSRVYVEGRLQARRQQDHGGGRSVTEIVLSQNRGALVMLNGPRSPQSPC